MFDGGSCSFSTFQTFHNLPPRIIRDTIPLWERDPSEQSLPRVSKKCPQLLRCHDQNACTKYEVSSMQIYSYFIWTRKWYIRMALPLHSVKLDTFSFAHQCCWSFYLNVVKARNQTWSNWAPCKLNRSAQYSQLLKLWQHIGAAWKRGAMKMYFAHGFIFSFNLWIIFERDKFDIRSFPTMFTTFDCSNQR